MKKNQILNAEVLLLSSLLVFMGCSDSVPNGSIKWEGAFQIDDVGGAIVSQKMTAILSGDTFAAADEFISDAHPGYTVAHLPADLTLSATRPTTTRVIFTLRGKAISPANSSNLGITFTDAAFPNNDAANVENYAKTGIPITIGGPHAVQSAPFDSTTSNKKVTIRLEGGTFVTMPLAMSWFTLDAAGTGGFAALTGESVWRDVNNTEAVIDGLAFPTTPGSGQRITVAGAAQATQATAVTVVAGP
jgi:hypothetical protein